MPGWTRGCRMSERSCHPERNCHPERSEGSSPQDRNSATSVRESRARSLVAALLGMTVPLAALLLLLPPAPAHAQSLAKRLDARLDRPPFDRQLWGVAVVDDRGHLLFGRNERSLFTPASNTKIVVAAVASALLPPDWTVRTSVYAGGPMSGGTLQGDLILYGRGDPTFSRRCYAVDTTRAGACETNSITRLAQLAEALRARGIREIHGDVVGDGSYFEPGTVNPNWE